MLFCQSAHSAKQTRVTSVLPHDTYQSVKSTEAMQTKCLAEGQNMLAQPWIVPSIFVSLNRLLNLVTSMLLYYYGIS